MRGILLIQPFDADTRFVDRVTGRLGYGHVALVNDERDEQGRILGIDASIATGKVAKRWIYEITRGHQWNLVNLGDAVSAYMYEQAEKRIDQPYNNRGLLGLQRPGEAATCSQLVYECLPDHLRSTFVCWRKNWCTPNCLAKAFLFEKGKQWDSSSCS